MNGVAIMYGDVLVASGSDVKIDGKYVASRLDAIEHRLTQGGL